MNPGSRLLTFIWTSARRVWPGVLVLFSFSSLLMAQNLAGRTPPDTRTETVVETLHGVNVSDPYRWLENGEASEVSRWTEAQNAWTGATLDALPNRARIQERLSKLLSIGTVNAPDPHGRLYFYERREGQQNQPVLYVRDGLQGRDRVLIDPNALAQDGLIALDWWYVSHDGKRLAYGLSDNGDEKSMLYVMDVATGKNLPDLIPFTTSASVAWLPDANAFYYTRYPARGTVPKGEEEYHRTVFLHRLGEHPDKDKKIYEPQNLADWTSVDLSRDGRWLLVSVYPSFDRNDLYLRDLSKPDGEFVSVIKGQKALYNTAIIDGRMYVRTTEGAARGRVFVVDPEHPARANWREIIPESPATLESIAVINKHVFAKYLDQASSRIKVLTQEGRALRDIRLPALGTTGDIKGAPDGDEAFFSFSSFAHPPAIYRYDLRTGATVEWARVAAPSVDARSVELAQVWYPSRDGTRVSMFLVHRKGIKLDGDNPTLLYGYGGFNVAETPEFNRNVYYWLERGGVYAVANLRGGSEYGEEWHKAGMLAHKQNVFDDFIAAAEFLIKDKITRPERLAIRGGSNGGLLVAAALTQRPELFRAVICQVPLTDMLRYDRFLIAKLWVPEYGSAEDPEQFKYLYAYSPYHHVQKGTKYPAVLITTAARDSRVDPLHARKFAAALQAANASAHPVLLHIETKAGHGIGKPLTKQIAEATDMWSFIFWQLGMSV
jgi:prolyl oligopeptidase